MKGVQSNDGVGQTVKSIRGKIDQLKHVAQKYERSRAKDQKTQAESYNTFVNALETTKKVLYKQKSDIEVQQNQAKQSHAQLKRQLERAGPSNTIPESDIVKSHEEAKYRLKEIQSRIEVSRIDMKKQSTNEDRDMYQQKLKSLQDAKKIQEDHVKTLQQQLDSLQKQLILERLDDIQNNCESEDLPSLQSEIRRLEARIDLAKQEMYFPQAKGFRFRMGGNGVYVGLTDLTISEVSGQFDFSAGVEPPTETNSATAKRKEPDRAYVTIRIGGTEATGQTSQPQNTPGSNKKQKQDGEPSGLASRKMDFPHENEQEAVDIAESASSAHADQSEKGYSTCGDDEGDEAGVLKPSVGVQQPRATSRLSDVAPVDSAHAGIHGEKTQMAGDSGERSSENGANSGALEGEEEGSVGGADGSVVSVQEKELDKAVQSDGQDGIEEAVCEQEIENDPLWDPLSSVLASCKDDGRVESGGGGVERDGAQHRGEEVAGGDGVGERGVVKEVGECSEAKKEGVSERAVSNEIFLKTIKEREDKRVGADQDGLGIESKLQMKPAGHLLTSAYLNQLERQQAAQGPAVKPARSTRRRQSRLTSASGREAGTESVATSIAESTATKDGPRNMGWRFLQHIEQQRKRKGGKDDLGMWQKPGTQFWAQQKQQWMAVEDRINTERAKIENKFGEVQQQLEQKFQEIKQQREAARLNSGARGRRKRGEASVSRDWKGAELDMAVSEGSEDSSSACFTVRASNDSAGQVALEMLEEGFAKYRGGEEGREQEGEDEPVQQGAGGSKAVCEGVSEGSEGYESEVGSGDEGAEAKEQGSAASESGVAAGNVPEAVGDQVDSVEETMEQRNVNDKVGEAVGVQSEQLGNDGGDVQEKGEGEGANEAQSADVLQSNAAKGIDVEISEHRATNDTTPMTEEMQTCDSNATTQLNSATQHVSTTVPDLQLLIDDQYMSAIDAQRATQPSPPRDPQTKRDHSESTAFSRRMADQLAMTATSDWDESATTYAYDQSRANKPSLRRRAAGMKEEVSVCGSDETGSFDGGGNGGKQRRGLYVCLRGQGVQLVGEKGTHVPKVKADELSVAVEVSMDVTYVYDRKLGWYCPAGIKFQVLDLNNRVQGNNVPVPRSLIWRLLEYFLPKIIERAWLRILPRELGECILVSKESCNFGGHVTVHGPKLSTLDAEIALVPLSPVDGLQQTMGGYTADVQQQYVASVRARRYLGLTDIEAICLASMFYGRFRVLPVKKSATVSELCRFVLKWRQYEAVWKDMCELADKALQAVLHFKLIGVKMNFRELLETCVDRALSKPIQVQAGLTHLQFGVNINCTVDAVRAFMERVLQETADNKSSGGRNTNRQLSSAKQRQLDILHVAYVRYQGKLEEFCKQFKGAGGCAVAIINNAQFLVGGDELYYEGPVMSSIRLPPNLSHRDWLSWDIKLPDPSFPSLLAVLTKSRNEFQEGLLLRQQQGTKRYAPAMVPGNTSPQTKPSSGQDATYDQSSDVVRQRVSLGQLTAHRVSMRVSYNEDIILQRLGFVKEQNGQYYRADDRLSAVQVQQVLRTLHDSLTVRLTPLVAKQQPDASQPTQKGAKKSKYAGQVIEINTENNSNMVVEVDSLGFKSAITLVDVLQFLITFGKYMEMENFWLGFPQRTVHMACYICHLVQQYVSKEALDASLQVRFAAGVRNGQLRVTANGGTLEDTAQEDCLRIVSDVDFMNIWKDITMTTSYLS